MLYKSSWYFFNKAQSNRRFIKHRKQIMRFFFFRMHRHPKKAQSNLSFDKGVCTACFYAPSLSYAL